MISSLFIKLIIHVTKIVRCSLLQPGGCGFKSHNIADRKKCKLLLSFNHLSTLGALAVDSLTSNQTYKLSCAIPLQVS